MPSGLLRRAALVLLFLASLPMAARAQEALNAMSVEGRGTAQMLEAKAAQGGARVIVLLKAPPEAAQGGEAAEAAIAALQSQALRALGWTNFPDIVRFKYIPALAATLDGERLRQLLGADVVAGVYPDEERFAALDRSVPLIGGLNLQAAGATGQGVAVAVLDSGVDATHPFLAGKVVAEACFSTPGASGDVSYGSLCPNGAPGPGGGVAQFGAGAAAPCALDECWHGTHVAGIVAGRTDGFAGVAPDASIIAANVFVRRSSAVDGRVLAANDSDIEAAMEWVYSLRQQYRIAAVNLSLGKGRYGVACDRQRPDYALFVNLLRNAGIAVIAASGNNGFTDAMTMPACISGVVSVGATDYRDTMAGFSDIGAQTSLLAPGFDFVGASSGGIVSSIPGGRYGRMAGTSMAAAHVAGAFAVLRSALPDAAPDQILDALRQTGVAVGDPRQPCKTCQAGGFRVPRIQVDQALAAMTGGAPPPPPPPPPDMPPPPDAGAPPPVEIIVPIPIPIIVPVPHPVRIPHPAPERPPVHDRPPEHERPPEHDRPPVHEPAPQPGHEPVHQPAPEPVHQPVHEPVHEPVKNPPAQPQPVHPQPVAPRPAPPPPVAPKPPPPIKHKDLEQPSSNDNGINSY